MGREAGCGAATPQPNSGLRSSPRYFSAFSHTSPSGNLGNDVWMGSHEPRRSESTLRGKRLWPVAVRGPCRGDVALGAVLGWTGEAAAPGPPLSSRDRFHTHSGPRCPVAGIPWGLSLQLAYCSDHTGEEQCEPAIKKLQVGLHAAHQGSLNPAPRTGCEATPPSFLGSPQLTSVWKEAKVTGGLGQQGMGQGLHHISNRNLWGHAQRRQRLARVSLALSLRPPATPAPHTARPVRASLCLPPLPRPSARP